MYLHIRSLLTILKKVITAVTVEINLELQFVVKTLVVSVLEIPQGKAIYGSHFQRF